MKQPWFYFIIYVVVGAILLWAFDKYRIIKSRSLRYFLVILVYTLICCITYDLVLAPGYSQDSPEFNDRQQPWLIEGISSAVAYVATDHFLTKKIKGIKRILICIVVATVICCIFAVHK